MLDFDSVNARKDFHKKYRLRKTLKSETTRGYHYFYSLPEGETLSNMDLSDNVELKTEKSLITLPPSIHIKSGKPYIWLRGDPIKNGLKDIKPLPKNILKLIKKIQNKSNQYGVTSKAACAANLLDPNRILAGIPEGERNNTLFRYACSMMARNYQRKDVEAIILVAASNAKPQFPKKEALEAVKSAFSYSSSTEVSKLIKELNEKHAVIMVGGKCRILNEVYDPVLKRPDINFSPLVDFKNRYSNRKSLDQNGKEVLISKLWLDSPERREYKGIIFEPKGDVSGYYNLWRGFVFEPKEGHWGVFKRHIKMIIADEDEKLAKWILAWMARILQDPGGERPGTALVLKGGQGIGKGVFSNQFGKLFGNHFLHVSNKQQITGRFNHHLKDALLVFGDEVTWGGLKQEVNILKAMITEDTNLCEPKGENIFTVKNRINLIVASNSEWPVQAELSERRFCVLNVSEKEKQNTVYFEKIINQMENGGYEAMLYDLLNMDISKINLRELPKTQGLLEQKILSMGSVERYWYEKLTDGTTLSSQHTDKKYTYLAQYATVELLDTYRENWCTDVLTSILYADYKLFIETLNLRNIVILNHFARKLRELCPEIGARKRINVYDGYSTCGSSIPKRANVLPIPHLNICRKLFQDKLGMKIDWEL